MNRRGMAILAGSVVVLAGVAGWFRPTPLSTHAVNPHAGAWHVPTPADLERSSASQFAEARGAPWVGAGGTTGGAVAGAEWTLLGLVGPADDRAVLVRAGNDPLIKRLRPGDTLPDGSRLESVGTNGVVIDRGDCRMQRPLYPAGSDSPTTQPAGGACEPAGTD